MHHRYVWDDEVGEFDEEGDEEGDYQEYYTGDDDWMSDEEWY